MKSRRGRFHIQHVSLLAVAAAVLPAVPAWATVSTFSYERTGTEFNFTMIRGEETANVRSGFSNNAAKSGDVPGYAFGDYFDHSDYIRYDNVSLNVGAGQFLTMPARTGNDGNQNLQLRLYTPGSSYTNPVATYDATRFRMTSFGNGSGGRPGWSYIPFATDLNGNYDVEVVNTGGTQGSHIAGLGVWTPRAITAGSQNLAAADYSWGSGGKNFIAQTSNSVGTYLDNQMTSATGASWISYDLYNPDGATTFTASTFFRQGMGKDVNFYLQDVAVDGTVTNLGSITLPSTSWGAAFQPSADSGTFTLPEGVSSLRIYSDAPIHYNYLTLNATPVPEPASLGLLGLGAVALLRRRRR